MLVFLFMLQTLWTQPVVLSQRSSRRDLEAKTAIQSLKRSLSVVDILSYNGYMKLRVKASITGPPTLIESCLLWDAVQAAGSSLIALVHTVKPYKMAIPAALVTYISF